MVSSTTHPSTFLSWLIDIRRDLHRFPELSFKEHRTTRKIAQVLESLGAQVTQFNDCTGLVGLFAGPHDGPTIALRADIDALPIQELTSASYTSEVEGVMHACGHDANTAIMLGVAKKMADEDMINRMHGNVKFIFQPAEEQGSGAEVLIQKGVLDNPHVDRVFAGHMSPDLSVGNIGVFSSLGYASVDRFKLEIQGQGAHGARPEEGIDPIVAGAHFVSQIQSIVSRNVKPTHAAVVTIGSFQSGIAANVIPHTATLGGSIRAMMPEVRTLLLERLEAMAMALEQTFQVSCQWSLDEGVPPIVCDTATSAMLFQAAGKIVGDEKVAYIEPIMGSDDFAYFTMERPASIIRLGCSNADLGITGRLHAPDFDIDETVLEIGTDIFYEAICTEVMPA